MATPKSNTVISLKGEYRDTSYFLIWEENRKETFCGGRKIERESKNEMYPDFYI